MTARSAPNSLKKALEVLMTARARAGGGGVTIGFSRAPAVMTALKVPSTANRAAPCLLGRLLGLAMALSAGSSAAFAASADATPWTGRDAATEMSSEAATCLAYFSAARQCTLSDRADVAAKLMDAMASENSLACISGKSAGMLDAAITAEIKLYINDMIAKLQGTCVTMPIIVDRYSLFCKGLVERPGDRLHALIAGPPASVWP